MIRAFGRLRVRLLALVALATVPALAFILYSASENRNASRRRSGADAAYLARLASREHARQISGARELLRTLTHHPIAWKDDPTPCPDFLQAMLQGFPNLANIGFLTRTGLLACSVIPPPAAVDMSGNPAFERALRSTDVEIGEYQIGQIVRRPVLILAIAARDDRGVVQAVPFVALDLQWFNKLAAEADLPPGSSFTIVDRHGRILARSIDPEKWVGAVLPPTTEFHRILVLHQGVMDGTDIDGVERLFAFAPLAGIEGASVMVGISRELAFAAADRALRRSLLGLALIALFSAAAASAGAEVFVLAGIRGLVRATRRLGQGDLAVRAPERWDGGEVNELAHAFNVMAAALQTRDAEALTAQEQLRALSRRLQAAREEESARIARDLHDQLGQALTALKLDMAWLSRRMEGADGTTAALGLVRDRTADMVKCIDGTIELVRRISTELRPGVLDTLGLAAALEWQAGEFEARAGVRCEVEVGAVGPDIDPAVSTAVFRIFQEALTNVGRHAQARTVRAALDEQDGLIVLRVHDDGRGIRESEASGPRSIGVLGMRERANLLGGTIEVTGSPEAGTTIDVRIPLRGRGGRDEHPDQDHEGTHR